MAQITVCPVECSICTGEECLSRCWMECPINANNMTDWLIAWLMVPVSLPISRPLTLAVTERASDYNCGLTLSPSRSISFSFVCVEAVLFGVYTFGVARPSWRSDPLMTVWFPSTLLVLALWGSFLWHHRSRSDVPSSVFAGHIFSRHFTFNLPVLLQSEGLF